jgi:hypothetical protein
MLTSDPDTPHTLLLSSESKTGIRIPSGQIAGGQFVVSPGQTKDLDIDFMACESIVAEGNGEFRLKPVLHAGELSPTSSSSSINGKIIDGATGQPIPGGTTIVALEQKDAAGVDRVLMSTLADPTGAFVFCPVPAGTFDVVAAAIDGTQNEFGATVITGVQGGDALGTVPLTKQSGPTAAATISGQVTTSTGTAGAAADISVSAMQLVTMNSATVLVTIPLAAASAISSTLTTATGTCPTNTDCATYSMLVPAANPSVGTFIPGGPQTPAPPDLESVLYTIDARAFVVGGGNSPICNPSEMQTSSTSTNASLTVTAATSVTAAPFAFTGCQ